MCISDTTVEQGFFSGTYNALSGRIRHHATEVGEVSGRWSHVMDFKNTTVCWLLRSYMYYWLIPFAIDQ